MKAKLNPKDFEPFYDMIKRAESKAQDLYQRALREDETMAQALLTMLITVKKLKTDIAEMLYYLTEWDKGLKPEPLMTKIEPFINEKGFIKVKDNEK